MKLKLIAAALAFAAFGSANAAIQDSTSGNGELFVVVVKSGFSFAGDLGIAMDSFDTVRTIGESSSVFNMSGFTYWDDFLGAVGGDLAGAKFGVMAMDSTGANTNAKRMYTTWDQSVTDTTIKATTAGNFNTGVTNANVWMGNLLSAGQNNGTDMVAGAANNGSAWSDSADTATNFLGTGAGSASSLEKMKGKLNFNVLADAGEQAKFGKLSNGVSFVNETVFTTADANFWTIDNDKLVYAAPVPEADTYAFMALGMGLVGLLARRRKVA